MKRIPVLSVPRPGFRAKLMVALLAGLVGGRAVAAGTPAAVPARAIAYQLPNTPGQTYRVTLAITDAKNPDWIISTFVAGQPRTVTATNQGKFAESWNGLDDNFMPVPPGEYGVKGIYMPAARWKIDGDWHSVVPKYAGAGDSWAPELKDDGERFKITGDPCGAPLGDVDIAPGGTGVMYFVYLENAANNYRTDFNKPVGSGQIIEGFGSGSAAGGHATCTDGATVWSFSTDGGPKFVYRADAQPFGTDTSAGRRNVYRTPGWVTAMAAWRDPALNQTFVYVAKRGKIVDDGYESEKEFVNQITAHAGADGKLLGTLTVSQPRGIVARGGSLYVLHAADSGGMVVSVTPLKAGLLAPTLRRLFAVPAGINPSDLEVDSRGRAYLSDSAANKVYQFSPDGKRLRTFGRLAAQEPGKYDPLTFMAPEKLACWTDGEGKDRLLVVEMAGPNRLSEWNTDDGTLIREWLTTQTRANGGYAVDPRQPSLVYLPGQRGWLTRFRIDYPTGKWKVDAVWPHVGVGRLADRLERPKLCYHGDTPYLAFAKNTAIYRLAGNCWLASAAILDEKQDNQRVRYFWRDANGDGEIQPTEYTNTPASPPPGTLRYHGEMWMDDLSLVAMGQGTREVWRLPAARFDEHGNPVFEKWEKLLTDPIFTARAAGAADAVHGGNECADDFGSDWAQTTGSPEEGWYVNARGGYSFSANFGAQVKVSRYIPDGKGGMKLKWRVGRAALQGNAQPGEVYAPIFIDRPINGIFGIVDNSRAGYVLYTDEGMYVDTLFPDQRVTDSAKGGTYPQPGEFFTGYGFLNRENQKIYIAFGKTQPALYEVVGWSGRENPVKPLSTLDRLVTISAAEIAVPPEIALFVRGGAGAARVARFAPATGGGPNLDGSVVGWESSEPIKFQADAKQTVEVRCMYDPANLYLRWHVRLGRAFEARELQPAEHLFAHDRGADLVSFYLQGDVNAKPGGPTEGRPGDMRFICGLFKDQGTIKPVMLALYPKWFGPGKATPLTYKTPVMQAAYEHVGLVGAAKLGHLLDPDNQGFVIAAAIPRSVLTPLPVFSGALSTRVNFDANFGGHNRFWWANADGSANRETFDEPSESRLYPGAWAPALFAGLDQELFVHNWLICGPWGGPGAETFVYDLGGSEKDRGRAFCDAAKYPPDSLKVDLAAKYAGPENRGYWNDPGEVRWRPATVEALDTRIVLGASAQVWFGATWIYAPAESKVTFRFQGHPQTYLRYFLNGEQVFDTAGKEGAGKEALTGPVTLRQGWNQVIFRGFCVGYPPFRAGLAIAAPPETLWQLRLSGVPPAP